MDSFAQTPSKKKVEISTIASNYHIEMNPRLTVNRMNIEILLSLIHYYSM